MCKVALVLLFLGLMILMVIGVPISFVLGVTSVATIKSQSPLPLVLVIQRMFVGLNSFTLLAVPFFMLAANLMNNAGISNKLIRFSQALVGNVRSSLAHVNVIVSMIFAGISGSSQADTAGIGSVLIPAMEADGYSKEASVAVTAASSTIGVVIPPSIPMVVYGSTMGVSIAGLFLGGLIPGILVGLGQMLIIALLKEYDIRRKGKPFSFQELFASFLDAFWALGTPILIIGGIISGVFTATEAAVVASVYSLFVGLVIYRTLKLSDLPKIFMDTAVFSSISLFCVATASVFGWLLAYYHVPDAVSAFLGRFAESYPHHGDHQHRLLDGGHVHGRDTGYHDPGSGHRTDSPCGGHPPDPFRRSHRYEPGHWPDDAALWTVPAAGLYNCQDTGQASPAGIGALLHHHDRHLACGHLLAGSGDVRPETIDTSVLIILGGSD
jgi:C4-dicarboxylate transporter DctM subunit